MSTTVEGSATLLPPSTTKSIPYKEMERNVKSAWSENSKQNQEQKRKINHSKASLIITILNNKITN